MADRITISIPEELSEEIDSQLQYGDSRSGWIQDAIELKLDLQERGLDRDDLVELLEGGEGNPKQMMQTAD